VSFEVTNEINEALSTVEFQQPQMLEGRRVEVQLIRPKRNQKSIVNFIFLILSKNI